MHEWLQTLRTLGKQRGYAAVVVLTLGFGIGVSASLFSMVSAFFLQPLPVKDAGQLVLLMQRGRVWGLPYGHSFPDYLDYREGATSFSHLVAYMPSPVHLGVPGEAPERTWIEVVSPDYFALAGVEAEAGRLFRPGEGEAKGASPDVVLSHRYWQRRFGGDRGVVGRSVTLNGRAFSVIGVAPAGFSGLSWAMAVSAFVPSGSAPALMEGGDGLLTSRGAPAWRLMGRLREGATVAAARAEVEVVAHNLAADHPAEHEGTTPLLIPENRARPDPSFADFTPIFAAIFAAMVGLVLLISCANVANLMLSRSLVRRRDLALRSALGASRFRLVRMQVRESVLLGIAAGALGLVLAYWAGQALAGFAPAGDIPVNSERPWDWRVYAFTVLVSVLVGVGTGLGPALQASRFDLVAMLKGGDERAGEGRHRMRNMLVMGQVTTSAIVLICAGLFLHSLRQLAGQPLGFRTDRLLMASLDLGLQQYDRDRGRRFLEQLVERARALPGVETATLSLHVPFDYGIQITDVTIDGGIPGSKEGYVPTSFNVVAADFFEAAGIGLLRGRGFERADEEGSRRVAVVNATMASRLWPREEAVGKRLRFGRDGEWIEVVGVAADGKYVMMAEEPKAYFYLPLDQHYRSPITLMVRSAADPLALVAPLQRLLREMDPDLPIFNVRTMEQHIRESVFGLMPLRMGATMAGFQGLVALLQAVMGLYAVVAYGVTRRTREIGVRMALGAGRGDVLRLVVGEGMRLTVVGAAVGVLAALGAGFGLSRFLYGIRALDAGVFVGVTILLLGVSALACFLPARRATRIDPMAALRHD